MEDSDMMMSSSSSPAGPPPPASGGTLETVSSSSSSYVVTVHPLALINMADHCTRWQAAAAAAAAAESGHPGVVQGLLLGTTTTTTSTTRRTDSGEDRTDPPPPTTEICIHDAADIPLETTEATLRQVQLHQAVFPQHRVLGWYRVVTSPEQGGAKDDPLLFPGPEDLVGTLQWQQHYQATTTTTTTTTTLASGGVVDDAPFLLAWLQVPSMTTTHVKPAVTNKATSAPEAVLLPLSFYRLDAASASSSSSAPVLVAVEDWSWATSDLERMAVERVVQRPPSPRPRSAPAAADPVPADPGQGVPALAQLQHSYQALLERVNLLQQFLQDTQAGIIPFDSSLMRQIQGLLLWPRLPWAAASESPFPTTNPPPVAQLAMLAKTLDAIQLYVDKFRWVHDATTTSGAAAGGSSGGPGSGGGPWRGGGGGGGDHRTQQRPPSWLKVAEGRD